MVGETQKIWKPNGITHVEKGHKYLEPVCPLFLQMTPPKQGRNSHQNRGHLGSRYKVIEEKVGYRFYVGIV